MLFLRKVSSGATRHECVVLYSSSLFSAHLWLQVWLWRRSAQNSLQLRCPQLQKVDELISMIETYCAWGDSWILFTCLFVLLLHLLSVSVLYKLWLLLLLVWPFYTCLELSSFHYVNILSVLSMKVLLDICDHQFEG